MNKIILSITKLNNIKNNIFFLDNKWIKSQGLLNEWFREAKIIFAMYGASLLDIKFFAEVILIFIYLFFFQK